MNAATLPPMMQRRTRATGLPQDMRSVGGWTLVRVRGESMEPTLHEGDVVLARRVAVPTPGRIVLVRLPGDRPVAVKRALGRQPEGWWVERDNPATGVDSWQVGAIDDIDVLAQVWCRVWPLRRGFSLR